MSACLYTHPSNSTAAHLLMHVYTYICAYMHGYICICVHTHHPSNLTAAAARCSCHRCRQRRARRIVEYTCRFTTDKAAPASAESILRTCSHAHMKESQHIWGSHSTYIQKSHVYTQESLASIPTSPLVPILRICSQGICRRSYKEVMAHMKKSWHIH